MKPSPPCGLLARWPEEKATETAECWHDSGAATGLDLLEDAEQVA